MINKPMSANVVSVNIIYFLARRVIFVNLILFFRRVESILKWWWIS